MNRFATGAFAVAALATLGVTGASAQSKNPTPTATIPAGQTHIVGAAKLIIGDVKENQTFFEKVFNMKEVSHYSAKDVYEEPIMGFESGARLAIFHPLVEAPITKSQFPVALIYTPDLEGTVKRLEDNQYKFQRLPQAQAGAFKITIARDPSGNAIEILSREGKPFEVGGAKLIVNDRQKAEDFFVKIFGAKPGQRYVTAAYDEVLMQFGEGPFVALFQPKAEAPLPKSQYPVVAIYTKDFDNVLARVKEAGFGYRDVQTSAPNSRIIIAKDPAGNGVEIIRQQ
ncbi:MAG TPA: VOC family protein [Steroidobacteraceae bacterium]|nr:VOC family protein [Steroidobacteraceae bacterium]